MTKVALNPIDDKRLILKNGIDTLALGHWRGESLCPLEGEGFGELSFFKTFSCADFSVVVVNKTFLGHPQQSLVFPPNSTVPKIPHKHHSSSPKVHTNRISQKHVKSIRTHFDLLDLTKEFCGWGVCWKLGEIFVGKRGIVEDVPEMFY